MDVLCESHRNMMHVILLDVFLVVNTNVDLSLTTDILQKASLEFHLLNPFLSRKIFENILRSNMSKH